MNTKKINYFNIVVYIGILAITVTIWAKVFNFI